MRYLGLVAASAVFLVGCSSSSEPGQSRQDLVAERGAKVMPFDLEATTHRFVTRDDGLDQIVVADHPDDDRQVALVRRHLEGEAARFAGGDFSDPAAIHGESMPGLAALEEGARRIEVVYEPVVGGAAIEFRTTSPELVRALHAWADAQITDHGSHAESH